MSPERERALSLTKGLKPTPKEIARAAEQVGGHEARWAFTQWELRKRARAKFALADEMLFDRDGLEMATHERVAAYHASHFPKGEKVGDLCCGIGGDLVALARRGPVVGYEADPARADCARHNLAVHGLAGEVRCADAMDPRGWDFDGAFLDPQRRGATKGYGEPDPRALPQQRFQSIAVKLSPGVVMEDVQRDLLPRVEAVSFGGECREVLALSRGEKGIYAVHVESGEMLESGKAPDTTAVPGAFLFHADPAAIKARALGPLCEKLALTALGGSDGYLTGPALVASPWLRAYRVVSNGPADRKRTQAALQRLGAHVAEVKTRGVKEPAEAIQRRFRPAGDRPLTLAVWPLGKSLRHTLLEQAAHPPGTP